MIRRPVRLPSYAHRLARALFQLGEWHQPTVIGRNCNMSRPQVSIALGLMRKALLVERRSAHDRNSYEWRLTERGIAYAIDKAPEGQITGSNVRFDDRALSAAMGIPRPARLPAGGRVHVLR